MNSTKRLYNLAVSIYDHHHNIDKAAGALYRKLRNNDELREDLLSEILTLSCRAVMQECAGDATRQVKDAAISAASKSAASGGPHRQTVINSQEGAQGRLSHKYLFLTDFPTGDGRVIGKVYGRELLGLATKAIECADGHRVNAEVYRILNTMVPQSKMVENAITNEQGEAVVRRAHDAVYGGESMHRKKGVKAGAARGVMATV